jgi:hypothetical protein
MMRHGGGLAGQMEMYDASARRNKIESAAVLETTNQMHASAVMLWYPPLDSLMREAVRRAFTVPQRSRVCIDMQKEIKRRCIARGVPKEAFSSIDFRSVRAFRVLGNGSRTTRLMIFDQLSKLYSGWPAAGQEQFNHDFTIELAGADRGVLYSPPPARRVPHIDRRIAQLENFQLLEGDYMDPIDGENKMEHLTIHIEEMVERTKAVEEGTLPLEEFTVQVSVLHQHAIATLEQTTVMDAMVPQLNGMRQQLQQIGEVLVNGMRHIERLRRDEAAAAEAQLGQQQEGQVDESGQPVEQDPKVQAEMAKQERENQKVMLESQLKLAGFQQEQRRNDILLNSRIAESMARVRQSSQASAQQMAMLHQKNLAEIAMMDRKTNAEIEIERAKMSKTGA